MPDPGAGNRNSPELPAGPPHAPPAAATSGLPVPTPDLGEQEHPEDLDIIVPTGGYHHFRLLENHAPASVLITHDYQVAHVSARAARFLHLAGGEPTRDILQMVHPALRVELRAALFRATGSGGSAEAFGIPVEMGGTHLLVDLRVDRAHPVDPGHFIILFEERPVGQAASASPPRPEHTPAVALMEQELDGLRLRLRQELEQHEADVEELSAGNEKLQTMNEELRSAGEELESSREELQSINEELSTVNQELKYKVEELAQANADLANLMAATGVATIFLNRRGKITRYTPGAVEIFHLIPSDVGRSLSDLVHG